MNIIVFGATSAIAEALCRKFLSENHKAFLVGRNEEKLRKIMEDLEVRYPGKIVGHCHADLVDFEGHEKIISEAEKAFKEDVDTAIIAQGLLPNEEACLKDLTLIRRSYDINFFSYVSIVCKLADRFSASKRGTIVAISSVAGDRGRFSNPIYGSSKAALTAFLAGMRARLFKSGVRVVTVKPGIVDTPMTSHLKKSAMFAQVDQVADGIYSKLKKGSDVIYVPWFWRYIMFVIKHIPEMIFKKLTI